MTPSSAKSLPYPSQSFALTRPIASSLTFLIAALSASDNPAGAEGWHPSANSATTPTETSLPGPRITCLLASWDGITGTREGTLGHPDVKGSLAQREAS